MLHTITKQYYLTAHSKKLKSYFEKNNQYVKAVNNDTGFPQK